MRHLAVFLYVCILTIEFITIRGYKSWEPTFDVIHINNNIPFTLRHFFLTVSDVSIIRRRSVPAPDRERF